MIVSLYIKNCLVESIPVDISACTCYEHRYDIIFRTKGWLLYKYRLSIAIIDDNWHVTATVGSKLNLLIGNNY